MFFSSGNLLADRRYIYACAELEAHNIKGAADLAEQTIGIAPQYAPAWFLLGQARAKLDDIEAARVAFTQALVLQPEDALGAGPALMLLEGVAFHPVMPPAYVRCLFDHYAQRFDAHLTQGLSYRGPECLLDALRDTGSVPLQPVENTLDLGCGTGLMGHVIRPFTRTLAGCDLSPAMIEKARCKNIYDSLHALDNIAFLNLQDAATADLVLAADVLVYVGDLLPTLTAVANVLKHKGRFAFTVQRLAETKDALSAFALGDDVRFSHTEKYVQDTAEQAVLSVSLMRSCVTRHEKGQPVAGLAVVLSRSGEGP